MGQQAKKNEQSKKFHASHKITNMLADAKENIESLLDQLPEIFAIVDTNGTIYRGNHTCAKLLNCHIEQLLGQEFSQLFSEQNWGIFQKKLTTLSKDSQYTEFEVSCDSKAFPHINVLWRATQIRKNPGRTPLFSLMGSDISPLRAREAELSLLTQQLQDMVSEKTERIKSILDSIEYAILTIDSDMKINPIYSRFSEVIFETKHLAHQSIKDIFKLSPKYFKDFCDWYRLFHDPKRLKRWSKFIPLCPLQEKVIELGGRKKYLKIEYKPIIKDQTLSALMLICSDISEKIDHQEQFIKLQRRNILDHQRVLAMVNNNHEDISSFMKQCSEMMKTFERLKDPSYLLDHAAKLFMDVHTIKGNANLFGMNELSIRANDLESILAKVIANKNECNLKIYLTQWANKFLKFKEEFTKIESLQNKIFSSRPNNNSIASDSVKKLIEQIDPSKSLDASEMISKLRSLCQTRFLTCCQKYIKIVSTYRKLVDKDIEDLKILNPSQKLDPNIIEKFDCALLHILRNAIDHGIEDRKKRTLLNKGKGLISLQYLNKSDRHIVKVKDDGQGIDADVIFKSAMTKGLIKAKPSKSMSQKSKIDLIFVPGFSSSHGLGLLSGRGVGLAAAKCSMNSQGGTLEIKTKKGVGTTFILSLPK